MLTKYGIDAYKILNSIKLNDPNADFRLLEQYGYLCPACRNNFNERNGEYKNISSASAFITADKRATVPYCLCKDCGKKLTKSAWEQRQTVMKVEEFIFEKLPDLKIAQ